MTRIVITMVTLIAALAPAGGASAARRADHAVVFRAGASPQFFDSSPTCPAFSVTDTAEASNGTTIGSVEFCFETARVDAAGDTHAYGTATFDLRDGTITATLTVDEVSTADPAVVVQVDGGTIYHGTRKYRGATGSFSGGGPIAFDATGAHPDLEFALTLDRDRADSIDAADTGSYTLDAANAPLLTVAGSGAGRGAVLGRYTFADTSTVDPLTGAIENGSYTLTTAEGTIHGTFNGMAVPNLTDLLVGGPITGGTGRFRGAVGYLVFRGTVDPGTQSFGDVTTGWIRTNGDRDEVD